MPHVDDTTGQIADLLHQVTRRIRASSMAELAPVGLTHAQSRALRIIARTDEPIRMTDIAAALGIVPRAVTTVVDALEEAGLIIRTADSHDRRATMVSLTAKGRRLRERLADARQRAAESVLSELTASDQKELFRLLSAISGASCPQKAAR